MMRCSPEDALCVFSFCVAGALGSVCKRIMCAPLKNPIVSCANSTISETTTRNAQERSSSSSSSSSSSEPSMMTNISSTIKSWWITTISVLGTSYQWLSLLRHPMIVLIILAIIVPTDAYFNRGFTKWFHWMSIVYILSNSKSSRHSSGSNSSSLLVTFLAKFQTLIGTSICLGWYSTLVYDYLVHDKFCHLLYWNMPSSMVSNMVTINISSTSSSPHYVLELDFQSTKSFIMMILSHILDTIFHPMLTYYFWCQHWYHHQQQHELQQQQCQQQVEQEQEQDHSHINKINEDQDVYDNNTDDVGSSSEGKNKTSITTIKTTTTTTPTTTIILIHQIITWPVIVSTWLFSRCWCMTHIYYNFNGTFGLYYFGYDVYVTETLDLWYPAYIAESIFFFGIVLWKVTVQQQQLSSLSSSSSSASSSSSRFYNKKPSLLWSESGMSENK